MEVYDELEILDKYEETIFSFLAENCSEFNDEHIKKLVNLKVEQYNQLKSQLQQKENIIKDVREYIADRVAPDVNDYNIEFRLKLNTTVDEFIRHLSKILDRAQNE